MTFTPSSQPVLQYNNLQKENTYFITHFQNSRSASFTSRFLDNGSRKNEKQTIWVKLWKGLQWLWLNFIEKEPVI
jgi:hypothetical protein